MTATDIAFKRNAKPGKRIRFSNYCLSCGDPIPPNKEFCDNGVCENEFYRESEPDVEEEEVLAEQETLEREEGKMKSGLFEEGA